MKSRKREPTCAAVEALRPGEAPAIDIDQPLDAIVSKAAKGLDR
jgi:hypothetical protein